MGDTTIGWTEKVWNVVTGCDRVSPGCDRCYIERTIPFRMEGRRFDERGKMGIRLHPERLEEPLHWRKPRRVFTPSLGDLFHEAVPDEFIDEVLDVMARCPQHQFQVLTKRPQRMQRFISARAVRMVERDPRGPTAIVHDDGRVEIEPLGLPDGAILPNLWLGVSIESQPYAFRARYLLATPAAVRFLSVEPLLGPVDLGPYLGEGPDAPCVDWVIGGGESGPGARPCRPDWARSLRDQCQAAGVPFFWKQWGEWKPMAEVEIPALAVPGTERGAPSISFDMRRVGKKAAGRELDGRTWDEYPA